MIASHRRAMMVTSLSALLAVTGCTESKNYTTFEDCVLSEVTANQNEAAVVVLRDACRMKFTDPSPSEEKLIAAHSASDAAAITGDAAAADAAQAAADTAAAAADAAAAAADAAAR